MVCGTAQAQTGPGTHVEAYAESLREQERHLEAEAYLAQVDRL